MLGKRSTSEGTVGRGSRMARSPWVKLDCLNPNPDLVYGDHPSARVLENDVTLCIGMNRRLIHSLSVKDDQRGQLKG
jgi:hypothetical protein